MGADFSRLFARLDRGLVEHADRDGLTGPMRAVFLARGGHAPGTVCPIEGETDPHIYWCEWPYDECTCPSGHLPASTLDPEQRPSMVQTRATTGAELDGQPPPWTPRCHRCREQIGRFEDSGLMSDVILLHIASCTWARSAWRRMVRLLKAPFRRSTPSKRG